MKNVANDSLPKTAYGQLVYCNRRNILAVRIRLPFDDVFASFKDEVYSKFTNKD